MKLYYDIMAKYCAGCDPNGGTYFAGMVPGVDVRKVLDKAGRNGVTRENIMHIARNMNFTDSLFLLPGIKVQTSGDNQFPVTQEALQTWHNGASPPGWVVDKNIISAR